jgi:hypothetical protein
MYLDLTDTVAGKAIMETLAPNADSPCTDVLFGNDPHSTSRVLTEEEHQELLDTYHRLEIEARN